VFFVPVLLLLNTVNAFAANISVDGEVGNLEWYDVPVTMLISRTDEAFCDVSFITIRQFWNESSQCAVFAIAGQAPAITESTQAGVAFFVDDIEIARLHQPNIITFDVSNYHCHGALVVAQSVQGDFCLEVEIGCKNAAAKAGLARLMVQIFDPFGVSSRQYSYAVVFPAPETTAAPPEITTKTTTAKTPSTTTTTSSTSKSETTQKTTSKSTQSTTTAQTTAIAAIETIPQTQTITLPTERVVPPLATKQSTQKRTQTAQYVPTISETITIPQTLWTYPEYKNIVENAVQFEAIAESSAEQRQNGGIFAVLGGLCVVFGCVGVLIWRRRNSDTGKQDDKSC
jgi:hypothetical protein